MKARKLFRTIETHTLGQPTRNVVSGFRHVPGKTMQEKFEYMRENEDWFRKVLMFEPRGSEIMSGTLITEPCTPGTDVGVLYFEASCWMPMCGHDTMGVSVALIEAGLVDVTEPITEIKLDTPAGVVTVEAKVIDGVVEEVSFVNAPALVLNRNVEVETAEFGKLNMPSCLRKKSDLQLRRKTAVSLRGSLVPSPKTSTNRSSSAIRNCHL